MDNTRTLFLGLPLNTGITADAVRQRIGKKDACTLVTFINPASWTNAKTHPDYMPLLQQMDYVLPESLCLAVTATGFKNITDKVFSFEHAAFADAFFKTAIEKNASVMLVGGEPAIDERASDKLSILHKGLHILASVHGYGEIAPKIALVTHKNPDVVLVGMGSPRQEAFLIALRDAGFKGLAITVGHFLDHTLLAEAFYPAWADAYHMRWLCNILKEPKRFLPRYLLAYPVFLYRAFNAALNKLRSATRA